MKKKLAVALYAILTVMLMFTGCSEKEVSQNALSKLIDVEDLHGFHQTRYEDKETPYTLCFENKDGSKSLYIFTSPIAYYDDDEKLQIIDSTLVDVKNKELHKKGYSFENQSNDVKLYFPKDLKKNPIILESKKGKLSFHPEQSLIENTVNKTLHTDFLNRAHDAAAYQKDEDIQLEYLPTNSGVQTAISIKKKPLKNSIDFYIDVSEESTWRVVDNQYVVFQENGTTKSVVYTSFLSDSAGNVSFNNQVSAAEENGKVKYTIQLDEAYLNDEKTQYPVTISPSFELYRNKMPDSTIYEKKEYNNAFLSNFALLGNNTVFGESEHYLRFRINHVFKSYAQNVKSASYVTAVFPDNSKPVSVELFRLKDFWDSTALTWDSRFEHYKEESKTEISSYGRQKFDITEFVKSAIKDDKWDKEVFGLAMSVSDKTAGQKIIATSDNSLYQPYVRIDFYDLPWTFEKVVEINPNT